MKQIANTYSDPETLLEKAADSLGIKKDANELASLYLHPFSESEDANPPPIEPSEFRHLTSGLLDRLLRFALKRGPVILSCDPLPEDTELNTFMNNLLKRLDSYRVLVIGTRQQTPKRLGQTNLEDFEQINLETLDRDQTGIFCQQILGHPPSEELKTLVQSISGGNPVFLKELVRNRSLSELELNSDTLESDSTSLRLRELLEKKLRNLSKKQIQLLKLISCLGETPRKQWAVSVAPSKLDAEETVEQIIDMGYLRETAVTDEIKTLSFSPATLHTVVYEKLPNERRKKIHGYVINFLKENAHLTELRPVDVPAAMAYHLQQVNQFDKAAAQRLKAGKMHISHCDYNHAIEQLEQGLEMANIENLPENHKLRVSLNVKLLTAFRESGQIDRAKEILDGLPNLGKIPGSFREKVLHETGLVELEAGSLQTSQNAFRKLGKIASRNDDIKLEIKSLLGRAEICEKTNDVGEAAELLQNMASKVENVQNLNLDDPDDRKLFWTAYNQLGVILIRQKDYESAKKFLNTALKRARSIDDKRGLIRVLCNLGALCMKVRKMEQAEDYFEKALSFARDIGDLLNQTRILTNLGISNMNLNRYENSKKYFAKAKKLAEQIGWYEGLAELSVHIKKLKKNLSPKTS
jgi:tetratricopeptide (TPR) repeat protein